MKTMKLKLSIAKPFGSIKRGRHVLAVLIDKDGSIYLGQKSCFYLPGFVRLVGGGVDEGEDFDEALQRELKEELDIDVGDMPEPMLIVETDAVDENNKKYHNTTYVYKVLFDNVDVQFNDDVDGLKKMSVDELYGQGEMFANIKNIHLWQIEDDGFTFRWADYCKMFGTIHMEVAKGLRGEW